MMDINEAIKIFRDSEGQVEIMMRKAQCAQQISKSLEALRVDFDRIRTNIQCEIAVMEVREIINQ